MLNKENLIWKIFYLLFLIIVLHSFGFKSNLVKIVLLGTPIILLLVHAFSTLTVKRGVIFILLASLTGLIMEFFGLKYGVAFGGHYIYRANQLTLFTVPISVILYWAVFIYTGYCVVNSFLYWLNKKKPSFKQNNLWLLLLLILLDGWVVTAIDLFMDPIQVRKGEWQWLEGGSYFGVPIGNFIGWFLVTVIATGLFRLWEYFSPMAEKFNKNIFIIPVLGYGAMALSLTLESLQLQMTKLTILGLLFMLPTVIINIILFTKWREK